MPIKAKVRFYKLIQDSQDYGSDVEHMVSRVFFDLEVDGVNHQNLWSNVRQAYGGNYEEDPVEVDRPAGYKGPFNYGAFQAAAESYYRSFIGAKGNGIRIEGGATDIRMQGNTYQRNHEIEFMIDDNNPAW